MKFRTWSMPQDDALTNPNIKGLIRVVIPNVTSGYPEWCALHTKVLFEASGYAQEDYVILLQRWCAGHNLAFPEVGSIGKPIDPKAVAFWSDWTAKYLGEMDRLDQTPAAFFFDSERDHTLLHAVGPVFNAIGYQPIRDKWQGIRVGNWQEANYRGPMMRNNFGVPGTNWINNQLDMMIASGTIVSRDADWDLLQGNVQCPVYYYTPEMNADFALALKLDNPVVPWVTTPGTLQQWNVPGDQPISEWDFTRNQAVLKTLGATECLAWGTQPDEAWWNKFNETINVLEG